MHHNERKIREKFDEIIAIRDGIHAVAGWAVKTQKLCSVFAVERIRGACKSTGSERAFVEPLPAVSDAAAVPAEHFKIGPHIVGKRRGLCFLKVRKPRHIGLRVVLHNIKKGTKKLLQLGIHGIAFTTDIHAHVKGHLIIAAPTGVQLLPGISDAVDEIGLDEAVDVLIVIRDLQSAVLNIPEDAAQAVDNLPAFLFCDDSLPAEHGGMCNASGDVLFVETAVKTDGCIEFIHKFVCRFRKSSAPKLCHLPSFDDQK